MSSPAKDLRVTDFFCLLWYLQLHLCEVLIVLIVDRRAVCPPAFIWLVCVCLDEVKTSEFRFLKMTNLFVGVLGTALHDWWLLVLYSCQYLFSLAMAGGIWECELSGFAQRWAVPSFLLFSLLTDGCWLLHFLHWLLCFVNNGLQSDFQTVWEEWNSYIRDDRHKNELHESHSVNVLLFSVLKMVLMRILHESCRFSEPINKVAQNVCVIYTSYKCDCVSAGESLWTGVTKVADTYFYNCWVTQMLLLFSEKVCTEHPAWNRPLRIMIFCHVNSFFAIFSYSRGNRAY